MSGLRFSLSIGKRVLFAWQLWDHEDDDGEDGEPEEEPSRPTPPADLVAGAMPEAERRWAVEGRQGDPVFQAEDGRHDPGPPYESRRRGRALTSPGGRERRPMGFTR